jgi:transposase
VQTVNRLDRLLAELLPGTSKKDITALQAKALLSSVRPRDLVGKTRRRIAADELADLIAIEKKIKTLTKELTQMVEATRSTLTELPGVGAIVAGRVLTEVGDVARFADRNRFASWTSTAPLEASSGGHVRHRLSRAGKPADEPHDPHRRDHQIRLDTPDRAYYRHKLASGKTRMEAMRCLKRRISDVIFRQLIADAQAFGNGSVGAGPGGHCGATLKSSAVDLPPRIDASDQPLPGPAEPTLQPAARRRKTRTSNALPAAS